MDIAARIIKLLRKKGEIRSADIVKLTGFSREYVNRFLRELRDDGTIVLIGKSNNARYALANEKIIFNIKSGILTYNRNLKNENLLEDRVLNDIKEKTGIFNNLAQNVSDIIDYAFSEMLNNAIEHSQSDKVSVKMRKSPSRLHFQIYDKGIGIFNNLMQKKKLSSEMEAIGDLIKGKLTTDPKAHSGEGIFFTSKMSDNLAIKSSEKTLLFDNIINDIFVKDSKPIRGTRVIFSVSLISDKIIKDIFSKYTDESFEFSKTDVKIQLFKMSTEYISRSQARRILSGLEKFKHIALDFDGIKMAGQAFCDEIFRVWQTKYPAKVIEYKNANANIDFMIKRAIKTNPHNKD